MIDRGLEDCIRIDTRLAGLVKRYHTWPTIRTQTIGEHTWQLLRIYFSVVEEPDPAMIHHIMFHDIGEHYTGDPPYPVKQNNPELKAVIDMLEQRSYHVQLVHWRIPYPILLEEEDKKFFKQIELIEMTEFGLDEVCLGNSHGRMIVERCLQSLYDQIQTPSKKESRLVHYLVTRLNLFHDQYSVVIDMGSIWHAQTWRELTYERPTDKP